jgi:hypothetical protein
MSYTLVDARIVALVEATVPGGVEHSTAHRHFLSGNVSASEELQRRCARVRAYDRVDVGVAVVPVLAPVRLVDRVMVCGLGFGKSDVPSDAACPNSALGALQD